MEKKVILYLTVSDVINRGKKLYKVKRLRY